MAMSSIQLLIVTTILSSSIAAPVTVLDVSADFGLGKKFLISLKVAFIIYRFFVYVFQAHFELVL
jgi:hypothetical protein